MSPPQSVMSFKSR